MWVLLQVASANCLVITGTSVYEGDELVPSDLAVIGDKIVAVAPEMPHPPTPEPCTKIEMPKGSILTAGFVDPWSSLGVSEVSAEAASVDRSGEGDPIRAAMLVVDAYNPRSSHVPVRRLQGITSSVVVPSGGLVSGRAGWVRLAGDTQEEAIFAEVGMVVSFGGESRAMTYQILLELLQDARIYKSNRDAVKRNAFRSFVEGAGRADLEALIPVIDRKLPLIVQADRAADIEAVLRLANKASVDVVLVGGAEAWRHAEALADQGVAVVIDPLGTGAHSFDAVEGRADNGKLLEEAGVEVMFRSSANYNAGALRFVAGNAVRGGMSHQAAIEGLTSVPARAFGIADLGTLKAGLLADVVVWSGDPLEFEAHPLLVLIDGVKQPLESRHTMLFERYRTLPGSPVPALTVEPR